MVAKAEHGVLMRQVEEELVEMVVKAILAVLVLQEIMVLEMVVAELAGPLRLGLEE
jgi:hypothetical protein